MKDSVLLIKAYLVPFLVIPYKTDYHIQGPLVTEKSVCIWLRTQENLGGGSDCARDAGSCVRW